MENARNTRVSKLTRLALATVIALPIVLSGCANMREGKYISAPYGSVGTESRMGRPYNGLN